MLASCGKNYIGWLVLRWFTCMAQQEYTPAGCSKRPDFSPAHPWRLFHPPALSLPRQTRRPGTRLVPSKAATPRLTLVSRFTPHVSRFLGRSENAAGGLFQHPARDFDQSGTALVTWFQSRWDPSECKPVHARSNPYWQYRDAPTGSPPRTCSERAPR